MLCLLAFGDTALKSYFFVTSTWAHKKGCDNDTFRAIFPASGYLVTPKHCKTRKNAKCQIDPVLPSHRAGVGLFLKSQQGGGGFFHERGGDGRVSMGNLGRGANLLLSGQNSHQDLHMHHIT